MFTPDRPDYPRLWLVMAAAATLVVMLGARLAFLATRPPGAHAGQPTFTLHGARGSIWDRDGWLLAANRYAYAVHAAPNVIQDPASFAGEVAPLLGTSAATVLAAIADENSAWAPLSHEVSPTIAGQLRRLALPGLALERIARRAYPLGSTAAHLTGFVLDDGRVAYGIEAGADHLLRGNDGRMVGNYGSNPRSYMPPRNGMDIVLSVDRDLQVGTADILERAVEYQRATGGTVIVLEPSTGALLASVSVPAYDPNDYANSHAERFRDAAIAEVYEPGSVVKPLTLAAAFQAGVVNERSTYVDTGSIEVAGITVTNWDHTPHGATDMTRLLQYSLNVGAVHVATALGAERFYAALADFGFGAPTGIELPGEEAGLVHWPDAPDWYPGHLATNSFGQGLAATPLQVATAIAAIANDGVLMAPHVVSSVVLESGELRPVAPRAVRRVVSTRTAHAVRDLMTEVVAGRVTQAAVPGYSVAGKTGTSEIPHGDGYHPEDTIASFVGFLPANAPRIVVLVKIDRPRTSRGNDVAAPIFAEVARLAIQTLGIPPDGSHGIGSGNS